jgi:integrase
MTKAKRKLDLPMTDVEHDLLAARRKLGKGAFVFPGNSKSGHIEEPKSFLADVAVSTGIAVSPHDIRRTFATMAEAAEVSPLALKALMNHALGRDVTEGYVRIEVDRLRAPMQKIADRLKELCKLPKARTKKLKAPLVSSQANAQMN